MQIIEPTEKAFVLSKQEKDALEAAADLFEQLYNNMNVENRIYLYSCKRGTGTYTMDDILNISEYLNDFVYAETINEKE